MLDYYAILGVSVRATPLEIKNAYRRLARTNHPDAHLTQKELYEKRFKQINEAYQVLSDPQKKQRYDAVRFYQPPAQNTHQAYTAPNYRGQARQESYQPKPKYLSMRDVLVQVAWIMFIVMVAFFWTVISYKSPKPLNTYKFPILEKNQNEYLHKLFDSIHVKENAYFLKRALAHKKTNTVPTFDLPKPPVDTSKIKSLKLIPPPMPTLAHCKDSAELKKRLMIWASQQQIYERELKMWKLQMERYSKKDTVVSK